MAELRYNLNSESKLRNLRGSQQVLDFLQVGLSVTNVIVSASQLGSDFSSIYLGAGILVHAVSFIESCFHRQINQMKAFVDRFKISLVIQMMYNVGGLFTGELPFFGSSLMISAAKSFALFAFNPNQ